MVKLLWPLTSASTDSLLPLAIHDPGDTVRDASSMGFQGNHACRDIDQIGSHAKHFR